MCDEDDVFVEHASDADHVADERTYVDVTHTVAIEAGLFDARLRCDGDCVAESVFAELREAIYYHCVEVAASELYNV